MERCWVLTFGILNIQEEGISLAVNAHLLLQIYGEESNRSWIITTTTTSASSWVIVQIKETLKSLINMRISKANNKSLLHTITIITTTNELFSLNIE